MTSTRRAEPQSAARRRNLAPIRVSALIAGDRRALRLLGDDNIRVRKHQAQEAPFKGGITLLAGGKEAALIPAAGSQGLGEAARRGRGWFCSRCATEEGKSAGVRACTSTGGVNRGCFPHHPITCFSCAHLLPSVPILERKSGAEE